MTVTESAGTAPWQAWAIVAGTLSLVFGVVVLLRRRHGAGRVSPAPVRHGRRFALATLSVGILLLAGTSLLSRERIREEWYLQRLGSADPEGRLTALDRLVEMESTRAIPRLLEIVRKEAGVTQLGCRAGLALLVLSPEDSWDLFREHGPSWHIQLGMDCTEWGSQFLAPRLERALERKLIPEPYGAWALGLLAGPDIRPVQFDLPSRGRSSG